MQRLIFVVILLLSPGLGAETPSVKVLELVGKSTGEIEQILGIPDKCNKTFDGFSCMYSQYNTEITFINEKADWIQVTGFEEVPFDFRALTHVGLRAKQPDKRNPFSMHWQYHHGMEVISLFAQGKYVSAVLVRAYTPN